MPHPLWPLFDLTLTTPDLVMRWPREDQLPGLAAVARSGIHDPSDMPFAVAWTDAPSPQFERSFAQHYWRLGANWNPQGWALNLCAFHDGRPVGAQSISAKDFAVYRTVATGSWLGREFQGRGFGKQMRAAVLALAFDGLGARFAQSESILDNAASIGVSRSLGYADNGYAEVAPRGVPKRTIRFEMDRDAFESAQTIPVRIEGLESCLDMFGATDPPASEQAADEQSG